MKNFFKIQVKLLILLTFVLVAICQVNVFSQKRIRELNIKVGILQTGKYNAITDVKGVLVGHKTVIHGKDVRTGVTVILPHSGNIFQNKVKSAVYIANGFGKLIGSTQIEELGVIETPIALTNTLNVFLVANALIDYTLKQVDNKNLSSINPVVGETNDGYLNNIQKRAVSREHVFEALAQADSGVVPEGSVGAGTGTICFGFKGGIGTSSRVLPLSKGGYTVGVLVQTNFGGILEINGAPVGRELGKYYMKKDVSPDGSCMIVVATDAPLSNRNLKRLAKRATLGIAKTGGFCSNGSGDYVIAFSTHSSCRVSYKSRQMTVRVEELKNSNMSPLFLAVVEATQEAIYNSLFMATDVTGFKERQKQRLPVDEVIKICKKFRVIQ